VVTYLILLKKTTSISNNNHQQETALFLAEIQQLRTVVSAVLNRLAFSDIEFKVMSIGID